MGELEKKFLFTVLMSVYINDNDEFFDQAMRSILVDQTLPPDQMLLVVDGPIDFKKRRIIENYKRQFPQVVDVVELPRNVGQGEALNIGLKNCRHQYVARMDADDVALPDRFMQQVSFVVAHPHVDVSSGYVSEFNREETTAIRKVPLEPKDILKFSKLRSPVNHGACIYKKSAVLAAGGYNRFVQLQDYALFVHMIRAGAVIRNQSDILVRVRVYDNYSKKSGWAYFVEELRLSSHFYKIGHLSIPELLGCIVLRALPRLIGSRGVELLYRKLLR